MTIATIIGKPIDAEILNQYFAYLVNHFFKILPMREQEEKSLLTYMQSFQIELIGGIEFIPSLRNNASYLTLLSVLQYLIDNPECPVNVVKREVFRAISICNKLREKCFAEEMIV